MKEIHDILAETGKRRGEPFVLATLIRIEGSTYRRPGARMLICQDGHSIGTLSGGCIEDEVRRHARDVFETGLPQVLSFDTHKLYGCHGNIHIFVERLSGEFFSHLAGRLRSRQSCFAITDLAPEPGEPASRIRDSRCATAEGFFVQEIHPPIRLLLFGQGPATAPLRTLCGVLGWDILEFAGVDAFHLDPDGCTAAVVNSHNYGRDFAALAKLLPLSLRYVGLVGARKRRDRLINDLLDADVVVRAGFFSPAGLDLGAEAPEEIALSIVSEIQRVLASGSGSSLRERKTPIHATLPVPKQCVLPRA